MKFLLIFHLLSTLGNLSSFSHSQSHLILAVTLRGRHIFHVVYVRIFSAGCGGSGTVTQPSEASLFYCTADHTRLLSGWHCGHRWEKGFSHLHKGRTRYSWPRGSTKVIRGKPHGVGWQLWRQTDLGAYSGLRQGNGEMDWVSAPEKWR